MSRNIVVPGAKHCACCFWGPQQQSLAPRRASLRAPARGIEAQRKPDQGNARYLVNWTPVTAALRAPNGSGRAAAGKGEVRSGTCVIPLYKMTEDHP
jgi:hypothetical protein